MGLNKDLDDVRGRVIGTKPLPSLQEGFSEVHREERRKKFMMGGQHSSPTLEGSTFAACGSHPQNQQDTLQQRKGRPWCDHCSKPGHTKDTCWKIHDKPADWRPSKSNFDRNNCANLATAAKEQPPAAEFSHFTKEQLEVLQKLLNNTLSQHTAVAPSASMHAQAGNLFSAFSVRDKCSKHWIVDLGASDHMIVTPTLQYALLMVLCPTWLGLDWFKSHLKSL